MAVAPVALLFQVVAQVGPAALRDPNLAAVPEAHRWMTFPEMTRDEVVVFRAYDSECAEAGEPFWFYLVPFTQDV